MTGATVARITPEQHAQVRRALAASLPNGPVVDTDLSNGYLRRGDPAVLVRPREYPEAMFAFMEAIATAEIALREAGLNVRLIPDVDQRELVVAWGGPVPGKLAYLTADRAESKDLAAVLGVSEGELGDTMTDGYAYDNRDDLAGVLEDARRDHPDADFSRIPTQ